jgi:hypothetical protein
MALTPPGQVAHKDPVETDWGNKTDNAFEAISIAMAGSEANVPAAAHTHSGTGQAAVAAVAANTIGQTQMADAAIGVAELKLASTENSTSSAQTFLVSQQYALAAEWKHSLSSSTYHPVGYTYWPDTMDSTDCYNAYTSLMYLNRGGNGTFYGKYFYPQASPPHRLGRIADFGQFVYLHRRKSDGTIVSASSAPDPVWSGPWSPLPKGHPARMIDRPHPFADFISDPLPDDEEIVLVDCRSLAELEDDHAPEAAAEALLRDSRNAWLAAGIAPADLDEFEQDQTARADVEALVHIGALPLQARSPIGRRRSRLEAIEERAKLRGSSLLQEINEGRVACCANACYELGRDERDLLPTVIINGRPWREVVRVVRAA